jgi:hypothetical protein
MREYINIIESILMEGGNVFKNQDGTPATQRVNQSDVPATIAWIENITGLKFPKDKWLGSTGKVSTSGDLDLAVDINDISKEDLASRLSQWASSNKLDPAQYVVKRGEVHFKTPIKGNPKNGFVQSDFMFFPIVDWGIFYYAGGTNSAYKGIYRNILLSNLGKAVGLKVGSNGVIDRSTNKVVTADPDKTAELLLGKGHTAKDLVNVETIYKNLASDPNKQAKTKDFEEYLAKDGLKPPGENLKEEQDTQLTKQSLNSTLKQNGYENLKDKGNTTVVLVQIPTGQTARTFRQKMLNDILSIVQQKYSANNPQYVNDKTLSSLGGIVFADSPLKIVVKDEGKQGEKSAGVANELEIAAMIQSVIQKYGSADVTFIDSEGHKLIIENAIRVETTGKDVGERKKADVVIYSETSRLPVSIKKLNAEMWESADSLIGKRAREIIDKLIAEGHIELIKIGERRDGSPVYQLSKEVVMEPTEEEAMKAIFGTDINPEGGVVIQTFQPEHFKQDGNKVTVQAHAVITNKNEIPDSHVLLWILRNDSTRNSKSLGYAGIRPLGVTLQRGLGKKGTKQNLVIVDEKGEVVQASSVRKKDAPSKEAEVSKPVSMAPKTQDVGREKRQ